MWCRDAAGNLLPLQERMTFPLKIAQRETLLQARDHIW
jgi:hypothetical protein